MKRLEKLLAGFITFCLTLGLGIYQADAGLGGTGSISGIVREYAEDEFGNPVEGPPLANIHITLYEGVDSNWADEHAWVWVESTTTDANGFYEFTGLTERRYHLNVYEGQQVGEKHYIEADQYQVQVLDGAETLNIDFAMRQAGLVWGYVRKTTDSTPISYARVVAHAQYTEEGDDRHDVWVDENGKYELWLLPSTGKFYPIVVHEALDPGTTYKVYGGDYYICGEDGLHPEAHGYTLLGSATSTHTFSGEYSYYVIRAEPGYLAKVDAIQGSDSSYLWLDCAWGADDWGGINGSPPDGNYTSIVYQPDPRAGGYVTVNPGPGNTSLTVYIVDDGRPADPVFYEAKIAPDLYQSTLEGVHGPDFSLNVGGKIHGRVVNESGEPLENVEIDPNIWINGEINDPDAWTDADGYYTLISIPATDRAYAIIDDLEVMQSAIKYGFSGVYVGPLTVIPGETTEATDMTLLVAGMITGQITDENGMPIVGVEVEAWGYDINGYDTYSEDVYTDALGQYTLNYLAPGTYVVKAYKDGFTMGVKADVVVTSEAQVDCDLLMRSANQPIVSGSINNYIDIAAKDPDGVLLPYNDYNDYGYPEVGVIAMLANVDPTDEDYFIIDKFFVAIVEPDDGYENYFESSTTENPGDYSLVLPPGEVDLSMYRSADTEDGPYVILHDWHGLVLTEGAVFSDLDFTAQTNYGSLKGSISVPAGEKLKYKTRILAFNETDASPGLFDAIAWPEYGSTYNFAQLPAGTYTIRAITDGFVTQVYEHVEVAEGTTVIQDIIFTAGGTLAGMVTDAGDATPIEGAKVKVVETGNFTLTDASGSYTIPGLGAGSYTVEVSASGYATHTQLVSITDGATTTHNVTLSPQVGSIAGAVYEDGSLAPVNGATVVAYNTGDGSYKTATTVGGAYTITELIYGDYIVAANANGYDTVIYTGTVTIDDVTPDHTNIDIILTSSPPEFSVSSSVTGSTLSMTFYCDVALDTGPIVSVVTGGGVLGFITEISATQWEINYTVAASDTVVEINIEGGHNGLTGSAIFSFEISDDLQKTATTNVINATGGKTTMMGTQDNTAVYVPPFALAGADDTAAVALTIERYGDPGDSVEGTDDQSVSAVYDFSFDDEEVTVAENHTVTVTMSFELPDDMSKQEFEDTFKICYFNVNIQQWVCEGDENSGIYNVRINWNNYTIMFEVDHLSKFAAFVPETALQPPIADADGPYTGTVGSPITFDASGSYDPDGTIVLYEWDWNNDGTYDKSTASSTITHTWSIEYTGMVKLRVTDNGGLTGIDTTPVKVTTLGVIEVAIDIKPGSDSNSINLGSAGVIPVAILSSEVFDATQVDPATVSLAGAKVKVVGKNAKYLSHKEDVNGDGVLDLVCQVYTSQFMIEPGESIAVLEAETFDGTSVRGDDSISIVPNSE